MVYLNYVFIGVEVLMLFNLLIFVHELGHFLAAKWRGMQVDRFAIWFGKPIWKKKIGGVEYALGYIPAGGYVLLPQMATMEALEGKSETPTETLKQASALDKIIVAFAGPLFSFLLAVVFAGIITMVGYPVHEADSTTTIGYVYKDGPAAKAGLMPGDKILEVDGKKVTKFTGMGASITWRVVSSEDETIPIKVMRDGKELNFSVTPTHEPTKFWQRKSLREIKIAAAEASIIDKVLPDSPADLAGLKPGDTIIALNDRPLHHFSSVLDTVESHPTDPMRLEVERNGSKFNVSVTPATPVSPTNAPPRIGVSWAEGRMLIAYPGVGDQIMGSLGAMFSTFEALFSRKSDIKPQHLGGAVKILSVYALLFESENGWRLAIWFSVIMNVNLAILNLFPFPVLDGGHIALALIESVRRKPVSTRVLQRIQTAAATLLIFYMAYIAFYDVQELGWRSGKDKQQQALPKFAPKPVSPK
jgi:regulator of sigma E protease